MSDMNLPPLSTESWMTDEHGRKIPLYHGDDVEERERILLARIAELEADAKHYALVPKKLTPAMWSVVMNEHCVYDSAEALYSALLDAAMQGEPNAGRKRIP